MYIFNALMLPVSYHFILPSRILRLRSLFRLSLYTLYRFEKPHSNCLHVELLHFTEHPWYVTGMQSLDGYRFNTGRLNSILRIKFRFVAPQMWPNLLIFCNHITCVRNNASVTVEWIAYLNVYPFNDLT